MSLRQVSTVKHQRQNLDVTIRLWVSDVALDGATLQAQAQTQSLR